MKKLTLLLFTLLLLSTITACGNRTAVIYNVDQKPVQAIISSDASQEDVKKAIIQGCLAKGWSVEVVDDTQMIASIAIRNKHNIEVLITYSVDSYSIRYKDSTNMLFDANNYTIHRNYNRWIKSLEVSINMALAMI